MDLSSGALWAAFAAIVVANLLLSGDNAIVIAMAARSLPPARQKQAVLWGSVAAIALRIVLTLAAVRLLQIPGLKLAGALALLWIGVSLLADAGHGNQPTAQATLFAAVRTILVADVVMSLDNVIAVAGAADSAPERYRLPLLVVGLAMTVPLIVAGSTLLIKVMDRLPLVIAAGAALLGYVAGEMMVTDPAVAAWFDEHLPGADLVCGAGGALLVVGAGGCLRRRGQPKRAP
jgi:YjbE family integral membrane protein